MTSMVAFPMAVTERTQNRVISIFSYLAGKAAPRRPADFTGVFYAPEYPLDGLGSVSFLQISWIRPSRDMPVSLTQNPPLNIYVWSFLFLFLHGQGNFKQSYLLKFYSRYFITSP